MVFLAVLCGQKSGIGGERLMTPLGPEFELLGGVSIFFHQDGLGRAS